MNVGTTVGFKKSSIRPHIHTFICSYGRQPTQPAKRHDLPTTMKETIRGLAYVVGDAIDTDQMIPAEHLVYSLKKPDERKMYGRYAMSGIPAEGQ